MGALSKFGALSWADRALVAGAAALLMVCAIAVRLVSFRRLLDAVSRVRARVPEPDAVERVARAIRLTAPHLPGANCLPQALAARWLLGWYGHASQVQLGVAKNEAGALEAHAWVESGGTVVVGGFRSLHRYTPLSSLDKPGQPG